jgi:hypothetical protein
MASIERPAGAGGFLRAALAQMTDRRWLPPALLFLVFLGGTNAVLALANPAEGERPGRLFAVAGIIRVAALIWISVAALRIATTSPRRPWMPDGALGLYLLLSLLSLGAAALGAWLGAGLPELQRILVTQIIGILLVAPLSVWDAAAAVERPLALNPVPRLRHLGIWLPPLLLWAALLVIPLAGLHAFSSMRLLELAREPAFWPLAAADALLSTILVLLTLALRVVAYRSVARP